MTTPYIPADFATRPLYSDGMFLTSGVMTQEQAFFINWITLQTRLLYTAGVLSGLGVSNPAGTTLLIATGAGFDDAGNFLTVPNAGLSVTITLPQASPCYVVLSAPVPPPPSPSVTSFDGSAVATVVGAPPATGLVLAQVSLADNVITSITQVAKPVTSRLGQPGQGDGERQAAPAVNAPMLEGTATVPADTLTAVGRSVSQTVTFLSDGQPAFAAPPRVFVTPESPTAYAASVSAVTTSQFTLTMAAIANADSHPPVPVHWLALI